MRATTKELGGFGGNVQGALGREGQLKLKKRNFYCKFKTSKKTATMIKPAALPPTPRKHWSKTPMAIAVHVAIVWAGVSYYMSTLVKKEQMARDEEYARQDAIKMGLPDPKLTTENIVVVLPSSEDSREQHVEQVAPRIWSNREKFDQLASRYDREIDWEERWMGLSLIRRYLLRYAEGSVLELSCGTSRNMTYYPHASGGKLKSVTFVDSSKAMLEQSIKKLDLNVKQFRIIPEDPRSEIETRFIQMDVSDLRREVADNSYDTVIESFGLCSIGPTHGPDCLKMSDDDHEAASNHPVRVLNEMARVCKPDGKVLLLEHGQSYYEWLNKFIDKDAKGHFKRWGCWPNRDIEALIRQSDLEIEYLSRWHFGTTYYCIARPRRNDS